MGQQGGFAADPGRMRVAGAAVAESARTVRSGFEAQRGRLVPSAARVPGWAAVDAARAAADAWDGFVTQLHGSVAGAADSIVAAAGRYEQTDGQAAGLVGGVGPR